MRVWIKVLGALCLCLSGAAAVAQGLFDPVVRVGDRVVTRYELEQRIRFNQIFGTPGDLRQVSTDQLIDDRLRLIAAEREGVRVSEAQIDEGMEEFASRGNLTTEQFLQLIAQGGVDEAAFRDFVRAGIAWRETIGARFGPRAAISPREIDRAAARGAGDDGTGTRVLLSELVIPTPDAAARQAALTRLGQIAERRGESNFAAAARALSAAPSARAGGQLNWVDASTLPPAVRAAVLGLSPGQVSAPIDVPGAVAVFLLRDIQEASGRRAPGGAIDYATFLIPGGRSEAALAEAARVRARVDVCDDLYGVARGLPADRLQRQTLPVGQIPGAVAQQLAQLDEGEVSTALTTADGRALMFLMLCGRPSGVEPQEVNRAAIADQLRGQRLGSYASNYLQQLRAEIPITRL